MLELPLVLGEGHRPERVLEVGGERALLEEVIVDFPERVRHVHEPLLLPPEPDDWLDVWNGTKK